MRPWLFGGAAALVLLFGAALVVPALLDDYRSITIDPSTLRVTLHDRRMLLTLKKLTTPSLGSYYRPFTGASGTSIEHFFQTSIPSRRVKRSYMDVADDGRVARFATHRELVAGPFGTVYSDKDCRYYKSDESAFFSIHLYANGAEHEPPTVIGSPPSTGTLTYLNILRVLRGGPEYLVLSALYSRNGHLIRTQVDGAKSGDWLHSAYVEQARTDGVQIGPEGPTPQERDVLKRYGLPLEVDVRDALAHRPLALQPPTHYSLERDVVNALYDGDNWIAQDEYLKSGAHQTRYLTYGQTPESTVLTPICLAHLRDAQQ